MSYSNSDLDAVPAQDRNWGVWNYAALWVSMSLCIPTYMLASSLIDGGMNWWQAILTIFLGNTIVLLPMILNGNAGARYGIPFPVLSRASFGVRGANIPAILRAIVACGWFGIQTWIGGFALYQFLKIWFPQLASLPALFPDSWDLQTGPALTFFGFWLLNMGVVRLGIDSIRKLMVFKALVLPIFAVVLLFWAVTVAEGLGPILGQPSRFESSERFWAYFFPALTGMVGFWATLSLNIPDFTRYARSERVQKVGQAIALPPAMTLFAFVGVVVTSATTFVFGTTIWDPIVLAGKFDSPWVVSFAMVAIAISTLATNISANIVSPANDFSHLAPQKIDFKKGGYITGVIGLVTCPWKLIADPNGYIFTWLIAYSSLLGPIAGIMIADYYFIRSQQLHVGELYQREGRYWYWRGFNLKALLALGVGILPNIPGFLTTVQLLPVETFPNALNHLYHYAWFVGFILSALVYFLSSKALNPNQL
jgi:NCS1 family nucleobase:cation symporter-1